MCKTLWKCGKDHEENAEKGLYKPKNMYYNRVNIKFKRKEWMEEIEKAYSDYRRAYFRRQNEVTSRLTTLINISEDETAKKWLQDAIDFIVKEKL